MSNDKDWQRRTDEWIDATNESRRRKEIRLAKKLVNQNKGQENEHNSKTEKQGSR